MLTCPVCDSKKFYNERDLNIHVNICIESKNSSNYAAGDSDIYSHRQQNQPPPPRPQQPPQQRTAAGYTSHSQAVTGSAASRSHPNSNSFTGPAPRRLLPPPSKSSSALKSNLPLTGSGGTSSSKVIEIIELDTDDSGSSINDNITTISGGGSNEVIHRSVFSTTSNNRLQSQSSGSSSSGHFQEDPESTYASRRRSHSSSFSISFLANLSTFKGEKFASLLDSYGNFSKQVENDKSLKFNNKRKLQESLEQTLTSCSSNSSILLKHITNSLPSEDENNNGNKRSNNHKELGDHQLNKQYSMINIIVGEEVNWSDNFSAISRALSCKKSIHNKTILENDPLNISPVSIITGSPVDSSISAFHLPHSFNDACEYVDDEEDDVHFSIRVFKKYKAYIRSQESREEAKKLLSENIAAKKREEASQLLLEKERQRSSMVANTSNFSASPSIAVSIGRSIGSSTDKENPGGVQQQQHFNDFSMNTTSNTTTTKSSNITTTFISKSAIRSMSPGLQDLTSTTSNARISSLANSNSLVNQQQKMRSNAISGVGLGIGVVVREQGCQVRDAVGIDDSQVLVKLPINTRIYFDRINLLQPSVNDDDVIPVYRLHVCTYQLPSDTINKSSSSSSSTNNNNEIQIDGWVSLTGRLKDDTKPMIEVIQQLHNASRVVTASAQTQNINKSSSKESSNFRSPNKLTEDINLAGYSPANKTDIRANSNPNMNSTYSPNVITTAAIAKSSGSNSLLSNNKFQYNNNGSSSSSGRNAVGINHDIGLANASSNSGQTFKPVSSGPVQRNSNESQHQYNRNYPNPNQPVMPPGNISTNNNYQPSYPPPPVTSAASAPRYSTSSSSNSHINTNNSNVSYNNIGGSSNSSSSTSSNGGGNSNSDFTRLSCCPLCMLEFSPASAWSGFKRTKHVNECLMECNDF